MVDQGKESETETDRSTKEGKVIQHSGHLERSHVHNFGQPTVLFLVERCLTYVVIEPTVPLGQNVEIHDVTLTISSA